MTRLATLTTSLAALSLAACADAGRIAAPTTTGLHAAVTVASSSYSLPFNSTLVNGCTGEMLAIVGTQEFTFDERQTRSGKDFTSMKGVIHGVATAEDGSATAFHQAATTTTRQASTESPVHGRSSYRFTVSGAGAAADFVVRVSTEFVYDPLTGAFTTTRSSEKADCR